MTDSATPQPSAVRSVARNAAALAIASMLAQGILFGWQIVLSRLLPPTEYGIYGTISGMVAIAATVAEFGIGIIVVRDVARRLDLSGPVLAATLTLQGGLAMLAYVGLLAAGFVLGYEDAIIRLLPLAGLALFTDLTGTMIHNQLLARDQMVIPATIQVSHVLLLVSVGAVTLLGGGGLPGLYGVILAASACRGLMYWAAAFRHDIHTTWPLKRPVATRLMWDSAPLALNSIVMRTSQHLDKLIVTGILGPEHTAYLMAAFILVYGMIELLNTTMLVAVLPMMSRQYAAGQKDDFHFLIEKFAFVTLIVAMPIGISVSVVAPSIIKLIYRPSYSPAAGVLSVLIWYGVFTMLSNIFSQMLTIENRQRLGFYIRVSSMIVSVVLMALLIPRIGLIGAAVSMVCAEAFGFLLLFTRWERAVEYLRLAGWRLARLFVGAGVLAFVMWRVYAATLDLTPWLVGPALTLVVGLTLYAGIIFLGRVLAPNDLDFIRQVLVSVPGGGVIARVWR